MDNFDAFIELVKDKSRAPKNTGSVRRRMYDKDALVDWLCKCANDVSYDMRRIDEDPQKKKELTVAVGIAIDVMSGGSIQTDIGEYLVSQLITDAAHEYMQSHPSIPEWAGHLRRKLWP